MVGDDDFVTMGNVANLNFERTDSVFQFRTWVKRGSPYAESAISFW